jgi:hypothetical protein
MFSSIKNLFGRKQSTPWLTPEIENNMTREDWDRLFPVHSKPAAAADAPPIRYCAPTASDAPAMRHRAPTAADALKSRWC